MEIRYIYNMKPTRLLRVIAVISLLLTQCGCQIAQPKLLLIADIQYCDCPTAGTRNYSGSLAKLDSIVERVKTNGATEGASPVRSAP